MQGVGSEALVALVVLVLLFVAISHVFSTPHDRNAVQPTANAAAVEGPCAICLDVQEHMVQTNCRHVFCSECIMEYRTRSRTRRLACPMCRQSVSTFFPIGEQQLQPDVIEYNRFVGSSGYSTTQFMREIPVLAHSFVRGMWNADPQIRRDLMRTILGARVIVWVVFGVSYLLLPFDLLPESALGIIGILDDVIILAIVFINILYVYRTAVLLHQRQQA